LPAKLWGAPQSLEPLPESLESSTESLLESLQESSPESLQELLQELLSRSRPAQRRRHSSLQERKYRSIVLLLQFLCTP
jgi:hypothetical protein